jgi:ubiquinone/menaquinone biosynthesis C-methylase UbiE
MEEKSIPEIVELASAFYGSAVLFAALEKGVFAAVEKAGESTCGEIASATGCSERGMRLLLDACVAEGLLSKDGEVYSNTSAGRLALVPGGPADLSQAVRYNQDVYPAWGRLARLAETGRPVEAPSLHLGDDPERTRRFALAMRGRALAIGRAVVPMIDLGGGGGRLLDLAGGPGTYAELLVKANPGWTAVTVDVPAVSAVAADCIRSAGLADRVECRAGDYHSDEYEPAAYDAVTIFGALHQESPEQIVDILSRAARALKPGGRVFVLDMMTDASRTSPRFSALFAVNMALTAENGWVFSDAELKVWMREAGFEPGDARPVPPPMPHWLLSGVLAK